MEAPRGRLLHKGKTKGGERRLTRFAAARMDKTEEREKRWATKLDEARFKTSRWGKKGD